MNSQANAGFKASRSFDCGMATRTSPASISTVPQIKAIFINSNMSILRILSDRGNIARLPLSRAGRGLTVVAIGELAAGRMEGERQRSHGTTMRAADRQIHRVV